MSLRGASCIVLGGGGFIGANLCRRLAYSGLRVRAFGRRCLFPEALDGVEWYQGDFSDAVALAAAIETYDVVFHLVHATTPHSANLDMAGDVQQNVMSSLALMDISRKSRRQENRIRFFGRHSLWTRWTNPNSGNRFHPADHRLRNQQVDNRKILAFTSISMGLIIASCGSPIRSGLIKFR